jgi:alpha-1,2-mannosyltransferase
MLGHTVSTPTTFVIVVTVGVVGLLIAAGAYRRSSPVLGLLVVGATESLASPVSWSHHYIWMILLVAWLALAEDRPRAGEWYALGVAVLLWAAPYWWVPHGPSIRFAGRGWLLPVGNADALVFIVLLIGAAVRVARSAMVHPVRLGRRAIAPTAAGGS